MKTLREILAVLGLLFAILIATYGCFTLPQQFPTHFDANNIADGWSGKSSLWFEPAIACVVYVVMTLVRFLPPSTPSAGHSTRSSAQPPSPSVSTWSHG